MQDLSAVFVSCFILSAFFFGQDFSGRTYNGALYYGRSRNKVFFTKLFVYLIMAVLITLLEILVQLFMFVPGFILLPATYVLKCLAIRIFLDLGLFCIVIVLPFLFRSPLKAGAAAIAVFIILMFNKTIVFALGTDYYSYKLWVMNAPPEAVLPSIFIAMILIIVGIGISSVLFKRAELK